MNVERLISLIVAPTPVRAGDGLGRRGRSRPRRAAPSCGPSAGGAACGRVEAEHREERLLERRPRTTSGPGPRGTRSRRCGSAPRRGRPAARGSRRRRACARRGRAGSRGRCRGCSAASRRPPVSPARVSLSRLTPWLRRAALDVLAADERRGRPGSRRACCPVSRCSTSASSSCGVVIFFIRIRMSPRRSWLRLSVCSSSTSVAGACRQNCCLYSADGVAEAAQAERAELRRVLRVVRAPDGRYGVELAQAVPAGDGVGLRPRHGG